MGDYPAQIRAARSLIGWKQSDLAKASGISLTALNNIERGAADPRASTLQAIEHALERAGVVFLDENGGGVGVRLKRSTRRS
jgi:transcriptional regulator with XRE-family HTH domain